jgi:hypothetical protein
MKKQVITVMDQSAVADASRAVKRENYMLELMTDAGEDMEGMFYYGFPIPSIFSCLLPGCVLSSVMYVGLFLDAVTEEQRVNSRVEVLLDLAKKNNIDFWADENRARQIVQFQDRAAQVRKFQDLFGSTLAMVYNAMFFETRP